jgi:hypothetical protein
LHGRSTRLFQVLAAVFQDIRINGQSRQFVTASRWRWRERLDRVTYPHNTFRKDRRCNASVAPHGIVAARTKDHFHARAGRTDAGHIQHSVASANAPTPKRQQVDAGYHKVSAQNPWLDAVSSGKSSYSRKMLCLEARSASTPA